MSNLNLNSVILVGRLTSDPELKTTPSGVSVLTGSVAVNRDYAAGDSNPASDFIDFTAWRQTAEFISQYFRKGMAICIAGELRTRTYEKDGQKHKVTEVVVSKAKFVDSKNDLPQSSYGNNNGKGEAIPSPAPAPMEEITGDLPF